jgi:glycosyltransferase involved in cell wall biosynthesis
MADVTLLDQYAHVGGGQTVLVQVLHALRAAGHRCTLAAPVGGPLERLVRSEFQAPPVRVESLRPLGLSQGRKGVRDLLRLLASPRHLLALGRVARRADLVYVNGAHWFFAWHVVNRGRTPSVFHVHLDHSRAEKLLLRQLVRAGTHNVVVLNSGYVRERLLERHPELGSAPNLVTLPNALGRRYDALPFAWRGAEGRPLQACVIGRLIPEKGHKLVLDVARRFPAVTFHMLGGEERDHTAYAAELRASAPENVRFAGHVADVPRAVSELGVTLSIVPSEWAEPFGLSAVESMALSCVTAVRQRGELPRIAAATGALSFESEAELAGLLSELCTMADAERAELARRQHERTREHYGSARLERQLAELVEGLLAPRRPARRSSGSREIPA